MRPSSGPSSEPLRDSVVLCPSDLNCFPPCLCLPQSCPPYLCFSPFPSTLSGPCVCYPRSTGAGGTPVGTGTPRGDRVTGAGRRPGTPMEGAFGSIITRAPRVRLGPSGASGPPEALGRTRRVARQPEALVSRHPPPPRRLSACTSHPVITSAALSLAVWSWGGNLRGAAGNTANAQCEHRDRHSAGACGFRR